LSSKPLRADARRNRARILDAATRVFAEHGAAASTEDVAAAAGVAIGTVFRHFPAKRDLLAAILKDLLADLTASAADADLFGFFTRVVTEAADKRFVVDLLAGEGVEVGVAGPVGALGDVIDDLLHSAQREGAVRADVQADEVLALLTATTQGALRWPPDLRDRVLARVFAGLRTLDQPVAGDDLRVDADDLDVRHGHERRQL
jgi:AcrR family transcriptional regulator